MEQNLTIDQDFADQIPPLTEEEFRQLEDNILADGVVINPIITWNGIIIDGHNRWQILRRHPGISYQVFEKQFADRNAVLAWICQNQLGRRNLTPEQKKYLIGKQYAAEKKSCGGDRKSKQPSSQNGNLIPKEKTCIWIARENQTSKNYVLRAERYANGADAAEKAVPGIRKEILSGCIKPTANAVTAVADAPPEYRKALAENLRKERAQIREISRKMESPSRVTPESMLDTLEALMQTMIDSSERCFQDFPILLQEPKYREALVRMIQKPKAYLDSLERKAGE